MNPWTERSIKIANKAGYLDRLGEVYVMQNNEARPLDSDLEAKIRQAFVNANDAKLVHLLLEPEVFPVKDSYVGVLRLDKKAIDRNPKTISRIAGRLYAMGVDEVIREATRPKETNRQLGNAFKQWLSQSGYCKFLSYNDFLNYNKKGIVALDGSDKTLKRYAEDVLGCTLSKGIDLVIKKDGRHLIGEAKFLTTPGGEQDRGFDDASHFITNAEENATRIAILDGYVWLKTKRGLHDKIVKNNLDIFSALLLKDYLRQF